MKMNEAEDTQKGRKECKLQPSNECTFVRCVLELSFTFCSLKQWD